MGAVLRRRSPMALVQAADNQADSCGRRRGRRGRVGVAPATSSGARCRGAAHAAHRPAHRAGLAAHAHGVVNNEGARRIVEPRSRSRPAAAAASAPRERPARPPGHARRRRAAARLAQRARTPPLVRSTAGIDLDTLPPARPLPRARTTACSWSSRTPAAGRHGPLGPHGTELGGLDHRRAGAARLPATAPLLRAGEQALRAVTGRGTPAVTAVVHRQLPGVGRLFTRAGYTDDGTGPDAGNFHATPPHL
ncbi:hypothetical protein HBB16_08405 [Pseudonocardia sp. MCCB 268]|nr:hypothetical protein [Pseudonocardia cytotoxica]